MVEISSFDLGYRIGISVCDVYFQFGRIVGGAATVYVERKCRDRNMETTYQIQNMDFEPIIFESIGGCEMGTRGFLKNIFQEWDRIAISPLGFIK